MTNPLNGSDYFLVIGGGYSPTGNQASLEKNVLFFQRLLQQQALDDRPLDILFADGFSEGHDLQVNDLASIPLANRLMAEFFGTTRDLGMHYRSHLVPNIRGATSPQNIAKWFKDVGRKMQSNDRLILYVTAHGGKSSDRNKPQNTTIYLWNNQKIRVSDLVKYLDGLPHGVAVVTVMVQCHSGGFARFIFNDASKDKGLSNRSRCGFFATLHNRPAAGCTSDIDEANYQEYSSFFWAAIGGQSRIGESIDRPDYDGDGKISFEEAHAYTILTSNTIDLPIKTSGEFLRVYSKFGKDNNDDDGLLVKQLPYSQLLELAGPVQRILLETLSKQLQLEGDDRMKEAVSKSRVRGPRGRRTLSPVGQLKLRIANDLKKKWPELANVLSPVSIELVTTRNVEFIKALEGHPKFNEYRRLQVAARRKAKDTISPDRLRVKYERWVRVAENVILAENLHRVTSSERQEQYQQLLTAERGSLTTNTTAESPVAQVDSQ